MSEVVEIKTGTTVSDVVEQLAGSVGDSSICLPVERKIDEGEWVRFTVLLEDGTHVIEGIGRCDGSLPRGNPVSRYDLQLSELQFDERNEIMFERMIIARDAAKKGDDTGAIKLDDGTIEQIEEEAAKDESVDAKPASKPSVPPPMPATAATGSSSAKKSVPPGKLPAKSDSVKSVPLGQPSRKKKSIPPSALRGSDDDTTIETKTPEHSGPSKTRPKSAPPRPAPIRDEAYQLEVDPALVVAARGLEPRLPRKMLARDRVPGRPEAAVLSTAIRIGLAALDSIADES
jgi:hypothetical protein